MTSRQKCQAITKSGKQCSRNAEPNSNYCWQHQNYQQKIENETKSDIGTVLNENLPPELAAITMMYNNTNTEEKKIQNLIIRDKKNILREWFLRINMPQKFELVPESQLEYIWEVYLARINDLPVSNTIIGIDRGSGKILERYYSNFSKKKEEKEFDPFIFFSNQFTFNGSEKLTLEEDIELEDIDFIEDIEISKLEKWARDGIDFTKLRRGDVIFFPKRNMKRDRNDMIVIYNGKHLQFLSDFPDDYANLPKDISINDYPLVDYFRYTIEHNHIIWYKVPKDKKLVLIGNIAGANKYLTSDNYIIYYNGNPKKYFHNLDSILFSYSEVEFADYMEERNYPAFLEAEMLIRTNIEEERKSNTKILFQSGFDDYNEKGDENKEENEGEEENEENEDENENEGENENAEEET